MTAASDIRQRARELVEQLPSSSLTQAVAFMETLHDDSGAELEPEQPLLNRIQQQLSPEDQTRLSYLRQQKESEIITDSEYQELLAFVERVEQQDAERAEALIKLAALRKVDLNVVVTEFLPNRRLPNAC